MTVRLMKRSGVHIPLEYTAVFDQIFALICQSMLAAKCQNKSADFGQSEPTDFTQHCSVYNVQIPPRRRISLILYFELICCFYLQVYDI